MTYRRTGLLLGALLLTSSPAAAATPRLETMVVGKRAVLAPARTVSARATRAGGCRVVAGTALAALVATGRPLKVTNDGACSPSSLFVTQVGAERNRGQAGWVYKVGSRAGTAGAGDPNGAFGTGRRLRTGDRILWFWCVRATRCQRTLDLTAVLGRNGLMTVAVRAFDDNGRAVRVAGARVAAGERFATTAADGSAVLDLGPGVSAASVTATKPGLVPSFPERVSAR